MTDNITISEDRYENELTQRWLDGIATGWSYAAGKLLAKSGEAYMQRLDDRAEMFRELADWASAEAASAETHAENHKKEYLTP